MARPSKAGGKKSSAKAGKASPARSRNRATAPDLGAELKEARERQAATAEILKVIARSPDNVQPVFEVIVQICERLFGSSGVGLITVRDDGQLDIGAYGG